MIHTGLSASEIRQKDARIWRYEGTLGQSRRFNFENIIRHLQVRILQHEIRNEDGPTCSQEERKTSSNQELLLHVKDFFAHRCHQHFCKHNTEDHQDPMKIPFLVASVSSAVAVLGRNIVSIRNVSHDFGDSASTVRLQVTNFGQSEEAAYLSVIWVRKQQEERKSHHTSQSIMHQSGSNNAGFSCQSFPWDPLPWRPHRRPERLIHCESPFPISFFSNKISTNGRAGLNRSTTRDQREIMLYKALFRPCVL